ncbi:MAG TPA: hypothetical protein PKG56_02650 [Chitinophagaceae bacterium]|nr:lipopolysaccharide biosynthesis protein [Chitinophagaceae bacterium]HMZ45680.1 hypothetical protein [Chitinophagaceae bacterium]HNE93235.1 hypothetical protein [Chitinophagaceae bacterium]HNF28764.1 hypothetical protein [Chitinophagaceae bacterium]HNL82266.1 hypothetical protein [Chitinophagaceae bacterium]
MSLVNPEEKVVKAKHLIALMKYWWKFLYAKKVLIIAITFLGAVVGFTFGWFQKPNYKAELTFAPEDAGQLGGYLGIAAQFGIDLGMGSGNVFEGENITELFKSSTLISNTLYSEATIGGKNQTLIAYKIASKYKKNKPVLDSLQLHQVNFNQSLQNKALGIRFADSLVKAIIKETSKSLDVNKVDKKLNIIKVSFTDKDEVFAKLFVDLLAQNAIKYYTGYKSKKARDNVEILQHQADSVKRMLFGGIGDVASMNDLNVNPTKQTARVSTQKRTIDVQVNGAIYTEILKNLELAKIALRKETPFIQIIDRPYYPLERSRIGRLLGAILGTFIFGFGIVFFLVIKKSFKEE